ncbi:putative transcriptional regulatory protein C1F7.11c [Hypsizygus marmoreus]|uniref:Transcriptional regulatory protein C1F7.11c n=1 Tax=Hypsizygus marmoreus TaxID=39966 RepID=A0A369K687_HYPMA|nr:putative transcriptional regulatory protein C1F7.11c [Hypsizygus marmoreus]
MAPQPTRKDATSQRAQDKESKRARGALSCAECRRLKLKCDKTVPCSSCKRRGCSAICPNGSLITGQGTRFVLADTEKLHQKIGVMSDRIRQLEDALAILQSTQTRDPHPLLDRELLKIKSSIELHSAVEGEEGSSSQPQEDIEESQYIDAFGTLAIRDDGAATFYGRSAGSESLLIGEAASPQSQSQNQQHDWQGGALPPPIQNLSASFPLSSSMQPGIDLDHLIHAYLPSWPTAWHLCELYMEQAPWFFGAVTRRQLYEEMLPLWYIEAPKAPTPVNVNTKGGAHDLALLFVIFCFGALTDMSLPPAPDNPEADHYYQLTKAALTLEPVLDRPPSVATVQTLSLMAIYEGLCSGENSIESTWALMGLATKLSQSIGLHRDCARWKLTPAEVQKRRALFWELFITDCWQSLATGRLATFSLPFVDCELPFDPDQTMSDDGTIQPSFPFWKARFGAECVSAVVQGTLTSRAPRYSIILELDRKVRDMELPGYAQGSPPEGAGLSQTMSHFMPTNYRELTLLYIHRCFFAHAISSHPQDPIKSQYAPSFLAGYRSACTIIGSVKQQFSMFPAQIARFWVLWTHAFSAAVMLASVVTHSSQSKVAPAALLELRTACDLFQQASTYGGRAVKFLPILRRLQMKAQQIYLETNSGIPPSIPNDIFKPTPTNDRKDELSIFSGQTHTVATVSSKSNTTPPSRARPSPQATSSRSSSDSPHAPVYTTDNPSFAGVHPSLVSELHQFDGQIAARVRDAYHMGDGVFAAPVPVDGSGSRERMHQMHVVEQQQQQRHEQELMAREQLERQQTEARERERLEIARVQQEREQRQYLEQQQIQEQQLQYQRQQQQEQEQQLQYQRQQQQEQQQQQQRMRQQEQLEQRRQLQRQRSQRELQPQQHQEHQQQFQAQSVHPQYHQQYEQHPVYAPSQVSPDHQHVVPMPVLAPAPVPASAPIRHHRHSLSHAQSLSNIHQVFAQQQQASPPQQPIHHQHQQQQQQVNPQSHSRQHSMYAVPSEYRMHPSPPDSVASVVSGSSTSASATSHFAVPDQAYPHPQVHTHAHMQPESSAEGYQYWPATGYTNPSQLAQGQHQQHHYTPDAALQGIAADDRSLQETWQSYMYKVGSPRLMFED